MTDWIESLLAESDLLRMGHGQRAADRNLGFGWIYYALARVLRPSLVVVIGSFRGFVPILFGKALRENVEGGEVVFIDPSLADDFWTDPQSVTAHFARFGAANVRHHRMTTQQFVSSDAYRALGRIGILHVDGLHTAEQALYDFHAFEPLLADDAVVLFHDSHDDSTSHMYGREKLYRQTVPDAIEALRRRTDLQLFELPIGPGLTLMRRTRRGVPTP